MTVKACPFCGSTKISIDTCTFNTICTNCFAKGPMFSRVVENAHRLPEREAAITAWNHRVESDETVQAEDVFR